MPAQELFSNIPTTTLATTTTTSATSWTVASSSGFPAATTAGGYFMCLARKAVDDGTRELVRVTNVSGTTWTVTRAQEGTSGVAWASGSILEHVITAGTLANMLAAQGNIVDPTNQTWARVDILDDGSSTASWKDRLAFFFTAVSGSPVRTGYHNEYGELRSRAAKAATVALRAMGNAANTVTNVFEVADDAVSTIYFAAGPTGLKGVGSIRSVGSSAPVTTGWVAGEFWYDTSTEV